MIKGKIIRKYWKDEDIFDFFIKDRKVQHSRELTNVNLLIDFDKRDNIVGIEINDFSRALKESQKEIDRMFKLSDKMQKESKGGRR